MCSTWLTLSDTEMPSHFARPLLKDPKSSIWTDRSVPERRVHVEIGNHNAGKVERENHVSRHDSYFQKFRQDQSIIVVPFSMSVLWVKILNQKTFFAALKTHLDATDEVDLWDWGQAFGKRHLVSVWDSMRTWFGDDTTCKARATF